MRSWEMLSVTLDIRSSTQIASEFQLQPIHNFEQFILLRILKIPFGYKTSGEYQVNIKLYFDFYFMYAKKRNALSNEY